MKNSKTVQLSEAIKTELQREVIVRSSFNYSYNRDYDFIQVIIPLLIEEEIDTNFILKLRKLASQYSCEVLLAHIYWQEDMPDYSQACFIARRTFNHQELIEQDGVTYRDNGMNSKYVIYTWNDWLNFHNNQQNTINYNGNVDS